MDDKDREIEAGRFAVALWRSDEHPGGMDWMEKASKMIQARDALIRFEALKEAADRAGKWLAELHGAEPDASLPWAKKIMRARALQVSSLYAAILADEPKI